MDALGPEHVAPVTLASTFVGSIVGVATFLVLSTKYHGSISPDCDVGIALGAGVSVGGYLGAVAQPYLPDTTIRRVRGVLVTGIGACARHTSWSKAKTSRTERAERSQKRD